MHGRVRIDYKRKGANQVRSRSIAWRMRREQAFADGQRICRELGYGTCSRQTVAQILEDKLGWPHDHDIPSTQRCVDAVEAYIKVHGNGQRCEA